MAGENMKRKVPTWVVRASLYIGIVVGLIVVRWAINGRPW